MLAPTSADHGVIRIQLQISTTGRNEEYALDSSSLVVDLKAKVKDRHSAHGKQIRLVYLGRILIDQKSIAECGIRDGSVILCVISEETRPEDVIVDIPTGQPTGFDRLAELGFAADDIYNMRLQFHTARQRGHLLADPTQLARLYQLEEDWMRSVNERDSESMFCGSVNGWEKGRTIH
eukprot:TRINITY_DN1832_c0_g1_i2.p1 TRINITY_DN1832_c0_g1~~TRINITY_DN1832_c0_g1_i2.p1  ORF type:complete len:178 (+),score=21.34 TRINITY_DN1832_c0_g1_i2:90-623(+)